MAEPTPPSTRVRQLTRRRSIDTPLFVPLVYALAAKVEGVSPEELVAEAGLLTRSLSALHAALGTDGIVCTVDAGLIAEACGSQLDWSSYPPTVRSAPSREALVPEQVEEVLDHPRFGVALEATHRLSISQPDAAQVAALPGPLALVDQLVGHRSVADHTPIGEFIAQLLVGATRRFCEQGSHVIIVSEDDPGPEPPDVWEDSLTTVARVARFHQALPVLLVAGHVQPLGDFAPPAGGERDGPVEALPADPDRWSRAGGHGGALVVTAAEVPPTWEIPEVRDACRRVTAALGGRDTA